MKTESAFLKLTVIRLFVNFATSAATRTGLVALLILQENLPGGNDRCDKVHPSLDEPQFAFVGTGQRPLTFANCPNRRSTHCVTPTGIRL